MSDAPRDPNRLHLLVLTPEEILFQGEVLWAQVPLIDGLTGIWPGHAPLVGGINRGTVEYATADGVETVAVAGGVLRVDEGRCIVLVGALAEGEVDGWTTGGAGAEAVAPGVGLEAGLEADLEAIIEDVLASSEERTRGSEDA